MEWSSLPSDLWSLIASKLTAADRARLRAVSKDLSRSIPSHQPIILLLPEEEQEFDQGEAMRVLLNDEDFKPKPLQPPPRRRFIPLAEHQIHHLDLPEAHEKRCVCSAGTWLVTVDRYGAVSLLNSFNRQTIDLPSQWTLPGDGHFDYFGADTLMNGFIKKVVFSSQDFTDNNWVAMAIYHRLERVAICRLGDVSWTALDYTYHNSQDIIYIRRQFFIADAMGAVSTYNIDTGELNEFSPNMVNHFGPRHRWYLAEWMGELLLVRRLWPPNFPYPPQKTIEFLVYKRDFVNDEWVRVTDLGDHCLFVGLNTTTCVPVSIYSMCSLERNCVYFSANRHLAHAPQIDPPEDTDDIGVYSLEDGTVRYFHDGISPPSCLVPLWVIPTLDQNSVEL